MPEATKNVLMTGTSSGIGSAASTAAAQAGRRVIATMRDLRRADGLRDPPRQPESANSSSRGFWT